MAEETAKEPTLAELQLGDIEACIKIIDVSCKRGAFNGDELSAVGSVRDRLFKFLSATKPKVEADAATPAEADDEFSNDEPEVDGLEGG